MKIRNGFISNSSSSSFVVAFPKTPQSVEELRQLLFGDAQCYPNPYHFSGEPCCWSAEQVAETVWRDMQNVDPLTKEQVLEEFHNGYLPGQPEYDDGPLSESIEEREARWIRMDKARKEFGDKVAQEFLDANPGVLFYRFSYADEDGSYFAALEHGSLFDKLPHFRISHH